jgi:hypothetical protein
LFWGAVTADWFVCGGNVAASLERCACNRVMTADWSLVGALYADWFDCDGDEAQLVRSARLIVAPTIWILFIMYLSFVV